jgi:hypothetical protein
MNLDRLREWLILRGIPAEELDKVETPASIEDLGNTMVVTLQNDNQLGDLVMSLFMQVNDLAMMVMQLQMEVDTLKNGGNA